MNPFCSFYRSIINIIFLTASKVKQESPPPSIFYLENVFLAWVIIGLGLVLSIFAFLVELTVNLACRKKIVADEEPAPRIAKKL